MANVLASVVCWHMAEVTNVLAPVVYWHMAEVTNVRAPVVCRYMTEVSSAGDAVYRLGYQQVVTVSKLQVNTSLPFMQNGATR